MSYRAVIDIGSNSVRMVIYTGMDRVSDVIFNEKMLCGLGEEVGRSGALGGKAVEMALRALRRFKALALQMDVQDILAIATAAVRDASNGGEFVERVKVECDLDIKILSGEEEALYAGYGAISSCPDALGIVGDLGGGSLELARLAGGKVHEKSSLPIGPFRLVAQFDHDYAAIKGYLKEVFSAIDWLPFVKNQQFYLVGGAWRTIGKILMRERSLALPVLQGFSIPHQDMAVFSKRLSRLDPEYFPHSNLVVNKRLEILPIAALVLRMALKAINPCDVIYTSYGLREGLLYSKLPSDIQKIDPFLFSCQVLSHERSRFPEHADLLFQWTRPLFRGQDLAVKDRDRLHHCVCLLSDIAWRGHPDFRAEKAVEAVLHGHFIGVSHAERAFVAVALNQAYGAPIDSAEVSCVLGLMKLTEILDSRVLGAALRLAHRLSGGTAVGLQKSHIMIREELLVLELGAQDQDLISSVVERRLNQLGQLLGRQTRIDIKDI